MTSLPISAAVITYLSKLNYRADASRLVCLIPLSGMYWEDEIPEFRELAELSEDDRLQVFRLFAIRYKLWDGETLSEEEGKFWNTVRSQVPNTPIFQRLTLSADDKQAHVDARQSCAEEFEEIFADAGQITWTDHGGGIQSFSAKFDLTKEEPAPSPKQSWWKRLFFRKIEQLPPAGESNGHIPVLQDSR